ncbi:acetoin reductase [Penicillium cataractarum]|uniref:Acetoin reductase n=1 Tax=Penicillium cataractarum TaxID=2100454 RepID=A0A9W9RNW3_9EURO|nr:acetoin reductase [Penicillium cataractarum]KAJ5363637.1 acetoin reductase [Penicillium cataractarum]
MPSAVVTGASQGIGRAIALRLADDGFDIVVNDLASQTALLEDLASEVKAKQRGCFVVTGDVTVETDVQEIVLKAVSSFGELNVMVANAGVIKMKSLLGLTGNEFDKVHAVNVRGVFLCYQAAAKQMIAQGKSGRIVGACSIAGYRPQPDALAYAVSKWGVRGLTQASAIELAPYGINVNAYCPGMVKTAMWDEIDAAITKKHGVPLGSAWDKGSKERPAMGKTPTAEDIAGCVSFLVGKDSRLITGQSIIIDGGIQFS